MTSFTVNAKEHYAKSFKIFREITQEVPQHVKILNVHLGSIFSGLNLSGLQQRHQINVLSVGSGSGEIDIEILKIIRKNLQESQECPDLKICNWVVEPNRSLLNHYEAAIDQLPPSWRKEEQEQGQENEGTRPGEVIFKLFNTTFQQFKETNATEKFDIIHFVHSTYYLDMEKTLVYCMEKILQQNGFVICIVQGQESLSKRVFDKANKDGECGNARDDEESDKIKKIVEKHKWKCEQHNESFNFDISEVFDEQSKTGNLLLDFLTHKVDFRLTSDEAVVQDILDFIIRKEVFMENGKYFGQLVIDVLLISQPY